MSSQPAQPVGFQRHFLKYYKPEPGAEPISLLPLDARAFQSPAKKGSSRLGCGSEVAPSVEGTVTSAGDCCVDVDNGGDLCPNPIRPRAQVGLYRNDAIG